MPKVDRVKLTKRIVDAVEANGGAIRLWDSDVPGFGVRVRDGVKSYFVSYGNGRRGGAKRIVIGQHGHPWRPDENGQPRTLTAELAREEAARLRGLVVAGEDPLKARATNRAKPTLAEFAIRYLREFSSVHKGDDSFYGDVLKLRRLLHRDPKSDAGKLFRDSMMALKDKDQAHAADDSALASVGINGFGLTRLDKINRAAVVQVHLAMRETPIHANRCLALLSHLFTMAEAWGQRPDGTNPCRHVKHFEENRRERFLSAEELGRLGNALTAAEDAHAAEKSLDEGAEDPFAIAAIRLLIFSGCRKSEIVRLKWENVNLEMGVFLVPKPKEKKAKTIVLNAPALKVLVALPRIQKNPYVIVGRKHGGHLVGLSHIWERLRKAAKLDDVHVHDLRHSFASVAVAGGASLPIIGALLGHRTPQTTARYAHLANDPLRAATEVVGARIASAMEPKRRAR